MDDLVRFCQSWEKNHGYAIYKANSHAGKNVYIKCDQSGHFQGAILNQSGRKTATLKINCPFHIKGSIPTSKKNFNIFWTMEVLNGTHNHDPSDGASSHSAQKRLVPEQFDEIRKLSQENLKPAQILLQLRTSDNETYATNKTISNALQKIRLQDLDGRKPIEALLDLLKQSNWSYDVKVNARGSILNLFFAHPGSIHLARLNHHVALLDSTYKTNRYGLPLLHVIGQTSTNRSFSVAFCFLTYEDKEGYQWAVENLKKHVWQPQRTPVVFITDRDAALRKALHTVFPESQAHLCTWHINKNITTNCKKYFPFTASKDSKSKDNWDAFMSLWQQVTYTKTAKHYKAVMIRLKDFLSTRPAVLNYLESNILPVKELFVLAWACQFPHLRNLNTSRVESGHAYLKTFIKNSTGDLLSVFNSLAHAVDTQLNQVHESIGQDTGKTLVNFPKSFIPLLGQISSFAIKKCVKQYTRIAKLDPNEPCSNTLTIGIGIPCAHRIAEILENRDSLAPEDFHAQWSLKYNPETTVHINSYQFQNEFLINGC
jgi:hypothetical protein